MLRDEAEAVARIWNREAFASARPWLTAVDLADQQPTLLPASAGPSACAEGLTRPAFLRRSAEESSAHSQPRANTSSGAREPLGVRAPLHGGPAALESRVLPPALESERQRAGDAPPQADAIRSGRSRSGEYPVSTPGEPREYPLTGAIRSGQSESAERSPARGSLTGPPASRSPQGSEGLALPIAQRTASAVGRSARQLHGNVITVPSGVDRACGTASRTPPAPKLVSELAMPEPSAAWPCIADMHAPAPLAPEPAHASASSSRSMSDVPAILKLNAEAITSIMGAAECAPRSEWTETPRPAAATVATLFLQEPTAVRSNRSPASAPVPERSILAAIAKLGGDDGTESAAERVFADANAAHRSVGTVDGVTDASELLKLLATIGDAAQLVGARCSAAARLVHVVSQDPYTKESGRNCVAQPVLRHAASAADAATSPPFAEPHSCGGDTSRPARGRERLQRSHRDERCAAARSRVVPPCRVAVL